ncbi:MAG: HD domain-containing protein [Candidatus Omnitrophica bacterium]|nr:HD domain-containing protein [Candidatus Omnitrophota bacterium]
MEKIIEAVEFATKAHMKQVRKGTDLPYILHPIGVGKILIQNKCPEECIIAGILHDVLEDTSVTFEELSGKFGERVADIVKGASEPDKSDSWENRKKHTIEFLKTASDEIRMVSCADKLDNIRSILNDYNKEGEKLWGRFRRGKEEQLWYYSSLVESFRAKRYEYAMFKDFEYLVGLLKDLIVSRKSPQKEYVIKKMNMDEIMNKFFTPSSLPEDGMPEFALLMGGPGSGKTTLRDKEYSKNYVLIDASEAFKIVGGTKYHEFGKDIIEPMEFLGSVIAAKAIEEKRNIVTEMIGESPDDMQAVINAMKSCGYKVQLSYVECDPNEAYLRSINKPDDDISAVYTQKYHQSWLLEACKENRSSSELKK